MAGLVVVIVSVEHAVLEKKHQMQGNQAGEKPEIRASQIGAGDECHQRGSTENQSVVRCVAGVVGIGAFVFVRFWIRTTAVKLLRIASNVAWQGPERRRPKAPMASTC